MARKLTFDIETIGAFRTSGDMFADLEVTVVGVHDSKTNEYRTFLKDELSQLWPLFERADLLVGYNSDHFDIPILNRYYPGDLTKIPSLDILKEIRTVLGRRLKLENVAQATLGRGKSGNGLEAGDWWAQGLIDRVREYCLDDVRLTKELYDYVQDHGSLKYTDFDGVREIKLNTKTWEKQKTAHTLTHTLPF